MHACHMPLIEQAIKDSYVAAHTFRLSPLSKLNSREFPTRAPHVMRENRMPGRSKLSAVGKVCRHGESATECLAPGTGIQGHELSFLKHLHHELRLYVVYLF
jgi:hypothetical protein